MKLYDYLLSFFNILTISFLIDSCGGMGPITIDNKIYYPSQVSLGMVLKNSIQKNTCTIGNDCPNDIYLYVSIEGKDKDFFSIDKTSLFLKGATLTSKAGSDNLVIGFSPMENRDYSAIIKMKTNQGNYEIQLTGTGTNFCISPSLILNFNDAPWAAVTRKSIIIKNIYNADMIISPKIEGVDKDAFSFDYQPSCPIATNTSDSIVIKFFGDSSSKLFNAQIYIDENKKYSVQLKGCYGNVYSPNIEFVPTNRYLDFGVVFKNTKNERFFQLTNRWEWPHILTNFRIEGSPNFKLDSIGDLSIKPNDPVNIKVSFSGSSPGTYFGKLRFDVLQDAGCYILLKAIVH
ncbi:MAG: hypothetical protein NT007_10745 [Candidatus Kapabacteria bacterium]|nr:hypothetical protein [Candidatus Kapabacteria bacterium]